MARGIHGLPKVPSGPPCQTLLRLAGWVTRLQGRQPAAVFYPLGNPTPYRPGFEFETGSGQNFISVSYILQKLRFLTPQPWNPKYIQINPDVSGYRFFLDVSGFMPDVSVYVPDVSGYIWMYPDISGYIPDVSRLPQSKFETCVESLDSRGFFDFAGYVDDPEKKISIFFKHGPPTNDAVLAS
jgi:hypothetical protein